MSSYQFVNTLAQCYAAEQSSNGAQSNPQEYYNMNYPNCYSPSLNNSSNYNAPYSLLMNATSGSVNTENSDFSPNSTGQKLNSASDNSSTRGNNCKFSDGDREDPNDSSQNVQECEEERLNNCSSASLAAAVAVAAAAAANTSNEPKSSECNSQDVVHNLSTSNRMSSSNSKTLSNKCNNISEENPGARSNQNQDHSTNKLKSPTPGESSNSGDSNTSPPQIYPWMKRVHIGQSKCLHKRFIYFLHF